jgi:hypothetical protein
MEASEVSFHLAEYAALRAEIDQRIASLMNVEREVVIGSFVLYAWLLGRKSIDFWGTHCLMASGGAFRCLLLPSGG